MARISILDLPTQVLGDAVSTPFVLVIDQVESESIEAFNGDTVAKMQEITPVEAAHWAAQAGAVGVILASGTLDIVRS